MDGNKLQSVMKEMQDAYVEIITDENGWETVFSFDREDNGTVVHLTREPTEQDHDLVADEL